MKIKKFKTLAVSAMMVWSLAVLPVAISAQTVVKPSKNKYSVQDDIKLGNQAANEVEKQFPILNDAQSQRYVSQVGERLVAAIPPQYKHPEFDYRFKLVNASDINAFALPGGPMYVNRGMIQAAKNEGEMAGVMAHEIAHVALRHGTAQATKQSSGKSQLSQLGLILGGAILGGVTGVGADTGAQLGMIGATAIITKYSRQAETEADVIGSQILANAGYDPQDLANMFKTIASQGGGRGPEWLSSHPDPGNRYDRINKEARMLKVSNSPIKLTRDFSIVKERLQSMPPAKTMAQIENDYKNGRGQAGGGSNSPIANGRYSSSVAYPSSRTRAFRAGNWLSMNIPDNWQDFQGETDVMFAPQGAYGDQGITHGAMLGLYNTNGNNLANGTREYINGILQANNYLRQQGSASQTRVSGRTAILTRLAGRSPVSNATETVDVYTVQMRDGRLLYIAAVAPQAQSARYSTAFSNMVRSIRLND